MTRAVNDRLLLALAAVAVAFAAADTYVVVLALPDMMASVGLAVDELQRAAPIVSGFLLGYVAMLPLIGRIADLRGRLPVLVGSLVVFALGSLVTAAAFDLPSMVVGRFLQGVGGGGLVPATLALVADLYPPSRRGVPLGVVGRRPGARQRRRAAVRRRGARRRRVGGDLRDQPRRRPGPRRRHPLPRRPVTNAAGSRRVGAEMTGRPDWLGGLLLLLTLVALVLTMVQPPFLTSRVTLGLGVRAAGRRVPLARAGRASRRWSWALAFVGPLPRPRDGRWSTYAAGRTWPGSADLLGAALLALALAGIILAFATADPEVAVFSPAGPVAADRLAARGGGVLGARAAHRGAARPARSVRRDARPGARCW